MAPSGSLFCEFQCPVSEFGVNTEAGIVKCIQQRFHFGYQASSLGAEQDANRADGFYTESGGCGACLMVIQDNPALPLSSKSDSLGLPWSQ